MENPLPQLIARVKEQLARWRPTPNEGEMGTPANAAPIITRPHWSQLAVWSLLFLASVFVGAGMKLATSDALLIGYDDFRAPSSERLYALNELRERALEQGAALTLAEKKVYPACTVGFNDLTQ